MIVDQAGLVIVQTYMRRMQVECEDAALVVRRNQNLSTPIVVDLYTRDSIRSVLFPIDSPFFVWIFWEV